MNNWIPNYIRKNIQYRPHEVLTAKEFNALLNLLITQGDYNSSWLEYLHKEGVPNAVADLNAEQISKAIEQAVAAEIDALTNAVANKSSARLDTPVFAFLNLSMQADMLEFRELVEGFDVPGSFCIATNFVGQSSAYPTLTTLQAMQVAGHDILPLGVDGSSYDTITEDEINTALTLTKEYMRNNFTDTDVFVYPGGTESPAVVNAVEAQYTYALNTALPNSSVESDDMFVNNVRTQIPVVLITNTVTLDNEEVKRIIDDTFTTHKCCIIAVDTSSTQYSASATAQVLEYITAHAGVTCTTVSEAVHMCSETINNLLWRAFNDLATERNNRASSDAVLTKLVEDVRQHADSSMLNTLQNCYISSEEVTDEYGNTHVEKYLNW